MKEALKNLLKVKSIVTICLTGLFTALACLGVVTGEQVVTIFTVIIGFYFGTQATKKE